MKLAEMVKVFDYVRENVPFELKEENSVDYIIDLKNGESFSIYDLDFQKDIYDRYEKTIDDFIEENGLDNVRDFKEILEHFETYKCFIKNDQARLIDFKDFVLKNVVILAKSEKVNYD